ncbi:hypothetical protein V5G20_17835 [Brevibacillus borstelensis]|uniref:hypothetical protein n=1 Tax=Brevibacillus borstelensis TaxID=45462 RepID=UPI0030D548E8
MSNESRRDLTWARKLIERKTQTQERYDGVTFTKDEAGRDVMIVPTDTHVVRSKRQIEAAARKEIAEKGRSPEFTFAHMDNIQEVIEKVSDKHCGYLLYLQCYVNYDAILENPDNTAMTKADMMRTLRLKDTAFNEFLREMITHEIIHEDKTAADVRYRLNPRYHFQGKTENTNVVKSFVARVKALYNEVNAKDLGFIYKLLPFVHLETNTICANPYEKEVEQTIPMSKADIAVLAGVDEKTVYRKLRKLKFGDQCVFAEVTHGNAKYYKINPFVFYRKNGVPDPTLREMFSIRNNFRGHKR